MKAVNIKKMNKSHYKCKKDHRWTCYWSHDIPKSERGDVCIYCEKENDYSVYLPTEYMEAIEEKIKH